MSSGGERLGKHSVTPSTAVDGLEETSTRFYFTFHSSFKSQQFAKCKIIMIYIPHITLCHWEGLESAWQNQRLQLCPEWNCFSACEQWSQSQGIQHQTGEFLPKTYVFFVKACLIFGPLAHLLERGVIFTSIKIAVVLRTAVKRKR